MGKDIARKRGQNATMDCGGNNKLHGLGKTSKDCDILGGNG
jgi:hypothetical protein